MITKARILALSVVALAGASGALIALAGPPFTVPALAFGAAPLLAIALDRARTARGDAPLRIRRTFLIGLFAGFVANAIALWWIARLLEGFAHFPLIAAIPVAAVLWAAQGLPFAFAAVWASALAARRVPSWLAVPFALTAACSYNPALFPWRIGASQVSWLEMAQIVDLGGEPLLDLVVLLAGSSAMEALRRGRSRGARLPAAVAALCLLVPLAYGIVRIGAIDRERERAPVIHVGVVQPNIGIYDKHDPSQWFGHLYLLQQMTRELEQNGAEVVIWPETAYPYPFPRGRPIDLEYPLTVRGRGVSGPVLAGSITQASELVRYNSALAIDREGRVVGITDKVQLLAFGEFVPLWDVLPPLQHRFRSRGLMQGRAPATVTLAGARIGVLNCYEDVLAHFARQVVLLDPDFLVNITNDAWFGDTSEPHLHELLARLRAIETRRDLVRAVNTGVSAHIAATGEELVRTDTWVRASFVTEVRRMHGTTLWTLAGDVITPALLALLLALAFALRPRAGTVD